MRLNLLLVLPLLPLVAAAQNADDARLALTALRAEDLRVATVAWRIAVANRDLCPHHSPWLGLVIDDLRQYAPAYRPAVTEAYGRQAGPAVEAVVPGGPAERAGAQAGDRIVAIDGAAVDDRPPGERDPPDYSPVEAVLAKLDAAGRQGPVRLTVERAGRPLDYAITPDMGCRSAVQLETEQSHNAGADGTMISIGLAAAAAASNDDELAVSIGHEMAHNILEHRARLDREKVSRGFRSSFGGNARAIRKTEDEADLLGLYLMAGAGYDVDVAPAYWERITAAAGRDPTHAAPAERRAITQAIVDDIKAKRMRGEKLVPPIAIPAN
jgi:hypothetical protein